MVLWMNEKPLYLLKRMSYFIYIPGTDSGVPSLYPSQSQQNFPQHPINESLSQYNFFPTVSFGNSQYSMLDYQPIYSQQDYMIGSNIFNHTEVYQPEGPRERKKRERNAEKEIESAKKNGESNIVNHFFSFFSSREKSEKTLEICIESLHKSQSEKEKLIHLFYNAIQVLNVRRGRKYVNRNIFKAVFDPEQMANAIPEIKEKITKISGVTIADLCQIFRKCCYSFYRTYSVDSVLTSKRISSIAKYQHFRKRRKVMKILHDIE